MKLKTFNANTAPSLRTTVPNARINIKTGLFTFNREAFSLMGLAAGSQIQIHQDESEPDCFYIEEVKEDGFLLRAKPDKSATAGGGMFNNCATAKAIQSAIQIEDNSFKMLIAGKATDYSKRKLWGLLKTGL